MKRGGAGIDLAFARRGSAVDEHGTSTPSGRTRNPVRLALGLTVLLAERVRGPSGNTLHLGVGVARAATSQVRSLAGRVMGVPLRVAARTVSAARAHTPGPGSAERVPQLRRLADQTRRSGKAIVDGSRADARRLVRNGIDDSLAWVERQAAPRVVDALVPHLVASVVPRIVDGILPHVERAVVPQLIDATIPVLRSRVLPVLIEDLTDNPQLRTLLLEQGRGVVGQATEQLRGATADADDRVESMFRGLVHRGRER